MLILGIDQSYTSTGYCVLDTSDDNIVVAGSIVSNKEDDIYYRAWFITCEIAKICQEHNPERVGVEGLSFGSTGNATRDLGGLHFAIVLMLRYDLEYPDKWIRVVPPPTLKKFATGNGRSDKDNMFIHVPNTHKIFIEELGLRKKQREDVVDAYWLAKFCENASS